MTNCPILGRVPYNHNDALIIKATQTGIVLMQYTNDAGEKVERKFKSRYTGSKQHAVDINGNLWLSRKELEKSAKKQLQDFKGGSKGKGKKKATDPSVAMKTDNQRETQISENLTTQPKKRTTKSYTVNKKEVRQRLLGYLNSQRGRKVLHFVTVSFPEGTPDETCYQAFNTWLTSLRKYTILKDYLWVAERQDGKRNNYQHATNTLHFHIAVPHYFPVYKANAMMRGTLKNLAAKGLLPGGICELGRKQTMYMRSIVAYNGVDLAKNRKTGRVINFAIKKGSRALASYLSKYVTKNDSTFDHLCWHNSRGYSSLFTAVTFSIPEFVKYGFGPYLNRIRVFDMRFCKFIPWLYGPPPLLEQHLFNLNSYIQSLTDADS